MNTVDSIADWIEGYTTSGIWTPTGEIRQAYIEYSGEHITPVQFAAMLDALGVEREKGFVFLALWDNSSLPDGRRDVAPPTNQVTARPKSIRPGDVSQLSQQQIQEIYSRPRYLPSTNVDVIAKGKHGAVLSMSGLRRKLG